MLRGGRGCGSAKFLERRVDVRKVDLSIELQILAYHEQRKAASTAQEGVS